MRERSPSEERVSVYVCVTALSFLVFCVLTAVPGLFEDIKVTDR